MTTSNAILETRIREALAAVNATDDRNIEHKLLHFHGNTNAEYGNFEVVIYRDDACANDRFTVEIGFYDWKPIRFKGEMLVTTFNDICVAIPLFAKRTNLLE
ncbi:MAG: hypothetical protein LBS19_07780 [Clostridiales bacterium]|jgi:hypothetical protein|nr:hypothetical protein [Clostridiales bacterium]